MALSFHLKHPAERIGVGVATGDGFDMSWPVPTTTEPRQFAHAAGSQVPRRDRGVVYTATIPAAIGAADLAVPADLQVQLDEALAALAALDGTTTPAVALQLLRSESAWSSKIEHIDV